jgi:hypothetical protein
VFVDDTAVGTCPGSTGVADQVTGAVTVLAVAKMLPETSTATHAAELVQAMLLSEAAPIRVFCHDPLVGAVETSTLPALSTAAHKPAVGHEIAFRAVVPSIATAADHAPAVGLVLQNVLPALSTATHRLVDGQETPVRVWPLSIVVDVHGPVELPVAAICPVGILFCTPDSVATQSAPCGHATDDGLIRPAPAFSCQPAFAAGLLLWVEWPWVSTPTQSEIDGHVTAVSVLPAPSAWIKLDHVGAGAAGAEAAKIATTAATQATAVAASGRRRPNFLVTLVTYSGIRYRARVR